MAYRVVLVGCGSMAHGWLQAVRETPSLKDRLEIVGLVDPDLSATARLRDEFALQSAATGVDLDRVLSALKPAIVFDVAVPEARSDIVLKALERGCHVLTEKPMAASIEEAKAIVLASRKAHRYHAVIQNRRYIDGIRRIRRLLETGALGELTALHADFFIGAHFGGFRDHMQNVLLLDMAIHTFDAARFISGKNAVAVYCHETNPRGSWYAHGAAANAIFELNDDVTFCYSGSWVAEGANTSWESSWRIIGTRGTILWDGEKGLYANVLNGETGFHRPVASLQILPPADVAETQGHASVIASFLNAIDTGRVPETAGQDNINSLAMVFGAIESARTHSRVPVTV